MGLPFSPTGEPPKDIPRGATDNWSVEAEAETWLATLFKNSSLSKLWDSLSDFVIQIMTAAITAALGLLSLVATAWGRAMVDSEEKSASAMGRVAALVVEDVLDVKVSADAFARRGDASGRTAAHSEVSDAIFKGIFQAAGIPGTGELKPSSEPAKAITQKILRIAIEDWLEGSLAEMLSLGQVEQWGQLGDNIVGMLGLNSVCAKAISPLVDATITTPHEWEVNKTYRPRLLAARQVRQAWQRGAITRDKAYEELRRQGYADWRIDALFADAEVHFTATELDYLVARGAWTREEAIAELIDAGFTREAAIIMLDLREDQRLDALRRSFVTAVGNAFTDRNITIDEFNRIIESVELPEREKIWIRKTAGIRRELNRPQLTEAVMEKAVREGLQTINDYRKFLLDKGYKFEDAQLKELLLLKDITDREQVESHRAAVEKARAEEKAAKAKAAAERRAQIEAQLAVKNLSLSQVERLVRQGARTLDDYRAFLAAQKYPTADQDSLVESLASDMQKRADELERREELRRQAAIRRVSLADLEDGVKRELITFDEFRSRLRSMNYTEADQNILVARLVDEIDDARAASEARDEARRRLAERDLSLSQFERAVRRGLRSVDEYQAWLASNGFDDTEAATLAGLVQADIDADVSARKRREEIAAKAAKRGLSLSQMETAVREGVKSLSEYRTQLAGAGFDLADQDTLVRLLELRMDADADAADRRAEAEARLATRRISLSDVERAVSLKIVPISVYKQFLVDAGFPQFDRDILLATLAKKMQIAADAIAAKARADAATPVRRISVTGFERAVRQGVKSISEYGPYLRSLGYPTGDAVTMEWLLRLQMDADAAGRARRDQIAGEMSVKHVSLSDFEKAVVEGLRPVEQYQRFIADAGYSAYDQAVLLDLLKLDIETRAAKPS